MPTENKTNIAIEKQLGPALTRNVKLTLPAAFWEYIEEVAIKQNHENKDLDEYCTEEILQAMIAQLDAEEITLLPSKRYMIPRAIAWRNHEILEHYVG